MATVVQGLPALAGELALYHTTDPLLGNSPVLVFHGPAATIGAASSRIQVHVVTPAGVGSYSRLSVSPNSPFYSAVSNLPREEQGDEVCRGLAFGLKKYFSELAGAVKETWCAQVKTPSPGALFGDDHIAILATRMSRVDNIEDVIADLENAFSEQRLSWLEVDVVLPPGTLKSVSAQPNLSAGEDLHDEVLLKQKYGRYAELIQSLGEPAFLPTSKLKRAPSKATAIGRALTFSKASKEHVRKELAELVMTEGSYVKRLSELQGLGGSLATNHKSKDNQLSEVFPSVIDQILAANSNFLEDAQNLLETTEATAKGDIEGEELHPNQAEALASDDLGLLALAKCLCEWFPKFSESYKIYLDQHAQASQTLRTLLRNPDSLAAELQEVGEQKLLSLLIEPVQRLPRYNLYVDSITKQLPAGHPALKSLLKARDVVTDICADSQTSAASTVADRLRLRTVGWPSDIHVTGRLITAFDYTELAPPYGLENCDESHGILLLFLDGIVMVEKAGKSQMSARALLTELESGSLPSRSADTLADGTGDFHFIRRIDLSAVQCTESHGGQALQLLTYFGPGMSASSPGEPLINSCHILRLESAYDSRASRFVEELAKARVESSFSEGERECGKWEFRATNPASESIGLLSAIYGDPDPNHVAARGPSAAVVIIVDSEHHTDLPLVGQYGMRTVVKVIPGREDDWRVTFDSVDGNLGKDHLETPDLIPAIRRKLAALASGRLAIEQPAVTACFLSRNLDIVQSIELHAAPKGDGDTDKLDLAPRERFTRPKSPKKLLSSFLSSVGPGAESHNVFKKDSRELPALSAHSSSSRAQPTMSPKPPSRESRPTSRDQTAISFSSTTTEALLVPHKKLEDALSAYILALQARKGNIVGKNLKMRLVADESLVNELYNTLLEDPNMMVLPAQATLDVLFAAFEKFLNVAWKDNVGAVMPVTTLQDIQAKAESLFPIDFDEYFRAAMGRLAPQNQRAFRAIMKLLADLLDGTGNDGDRGTLTACFAELLVSEGNPHDYIALIDRFVDDTDTYFGEPLEAHRAQTESTNSHKRTRSLNSSSLTSNTSSLRRKFGFNTLSRENSKSEQESKVASVWRSLSKNNRTDASPHGSISKATLGRSQSTDEGRHLGSRPRSQEGPKPPFSNGPPSLPPLGRIASNHNLGLSTIGEHPSFIPTGPPRKKRRSSLSDLRGLEGTSQQNGSNGDSPRPPSLRHSRTEEKELPKSPPTSTPSSKSNSARFGTPQTSPRSRLPSAFRRELSPGPSRALAYGEQARPKTSGSTTDEVVITSRPTSNIPSLVPKPIASQKHAPVTPVRGGLSERPGAGNIVKKPSPQAEKAMRMRRKTESSAPLMPAPGTPGPRKLRMQSPQKLRERLQNEQSSVEGSQNALQDELSKIGEELTTTFSLRTPMRGGKTVSSRSPGTHSSNMDLAQRVLKMEGDLPKQVEELNTRIDGIQADVASSLSVSEAKCKKLDELYREANAENEALYVRFNDELGKIVKAVRGGEGVEEIKKKLRESQEEAAKLRRETSRLKRENAGLRAQLKE